MRWTTPPASTRRLVRGIPADLLLELSAGGEIAVGRLGSFVFQAGWYVYAGSALGGHEQRVRRHLRPPTFHYWHVDYLRARAAVCGARLFPGSERRECALAAEVAAWRG